MTSTGEIQELKKRILKIDDIINHHVESIEDAGLFTGLTGILLHKVTLWQHFSEDKYYVESERILSRIFDIIETGETNDSSYCSGLAGVGLLMQYLSKHEIFDIAYDEILNEFNPLIISSLNQCLENNFLDFLYGATGIGIYLVETDETNQHTHHIEKIIAHIEQHSVLEAGGRRLDQLEPYEPPFTGCNFGLAHGLPAVLVFLTNAYKKGILQNKTSQLAKEFIDFIINNQNRVKEDISVFPNFITDHPSKQDRYSRLAWCYGDLGICCCLLQYAETFKRDDILRVATDVLRKSSHRTNNAEPIPIIDPFVCHGGAGLAHIFNRAYNHTGEAELKTSALSWTDETFFYLDDEQYMSTLKTNSNKADLLNGIAGTSIVLTSMMSNQNPDWDRFFLLS